MNAPMLAPEAIAAQSTPLGLDVLAPLVARVRIDVTAKKQDGKMTWTQEPLTDTRQRAHLDGGVARGCCPIKAGESTTRAGLFDLDSHKGQSTWAEMQGAAERLVGALEGQGMRPIAFRSSGGKGIHLFILWDAPQDAYSVRQFMAGVLAGLSWRDGTGGVSKGEIEVFPKQDSVSLGRYGSQFILPLAGLSVPLDMALGLEPMGRANAVGMAWPASPEVPKLEKPVRAAPEPMTTQALSVASAALNTIPNTDLDRVPWFNLMCAFKEAAGEDGRADAEKWSAHHPTHDEIKFNATWDSIAIGREDGAPAAHLFNAAARHGFTDHLLDDFDVIPPQELARASTTPNKPASLRSNLIPLCSGADVFDELPHCVDKWIPQDEVTLLAGHGGGGKSYVALSIAAHVALGLPFGPLATTQTNVLFFSGEDGARVLRQRLARICRALNVDPARLDGKLHLLDASDRDPALYREQRSRGTNTGTPLLAKLAELVQELDVGLVILDNASDSFDGDEIKRVEVRAFIRSLRSRLARPGRAVLLLAHTNKASATNGRNAGAEDYSGSTAWHNSVRSRLSLSLIPAGANALTIEHLKANLGAKAGPVRLEWRDGVPLVSDDVAAAAEQATAQAEHDQADKLELLTVVRDFDRRGERVTTAAGGPMTTFNQLRTAAGFPQRVTNSSRLTQLLRALQDEGRVFRRDYRTPDRKSKQCFTCSVLGSPESAPVRKSPAGSEGAG